jgi:hypothetical protein
MNSPVPSPTLAAITPGPMIRHAERGGGGISRTATGGRYFVGNREAAVDAIEYLQRQGTGNTRGRYE